MREIKFRGKDKRTGEWVYGYLAGLDVIAEGTYYEDHIYLTLITPVIVDPNTVGQFIGTKDKYGRDIYEGDIVKGFWGDDIGVIKYDESNARFVIECKKYRMDIASYKWLEVIGNIYDNPDLLKEV